MPPPEKTDNLADLPTPYLKCRVFGHNWEEFIPIGMSKASFGSRYSLLCTSCGTERHDLINFHGDVGQRDYRYPDGYLLSFAVDKADCRLEYNARKDRQFYRPHQIEDLA